jgi:hypothetical protein
VPRRRGGVAGAPADHRLPLRTGRRLHTPAVRIVTLVGLLIGLVLLYLGYRYV